MRLGKKKQEIRKTQNLCGCLDALKKHVLSQELRCSLQNSGWKTPIVLNWPQKWGGQSLVLQVCTLPKTSKSP